MDATAVSILRGLANLPWIEVAFLMDSDGRVIVSVGSSPAFSHAGDFDDPDPQVDGEPDTSLYVTAVGDNTYLGVLFEADTEIDQVRLEVSRIEATLSQAIAT